MKPEPSPGARAPWYHRRRQQRRRGSQARAALHQISTARAQAYAIEPPPRVPSTTNRLLDEVALLCERGQAARQRGLAVPWRLALHGALVLLVLLVATGELGRSWSRLALSPLPAPPATAVAPPATDMLALPVGPDRGLLASLNTLTTLSALPVAAAPGEPLAPVVQAPAAVLLPAFADQPHYLAPGESLGAVAARYGVSLESLIWSNQLTSGDVLMFGQALRIPHLSGLPYTIQAGDTLDIIATRFGVPAEIILAFRANSLQAGTALPVGQEIFIPGGSSPLPPELLALRGGLGGLAASTPQPAGVVYQERSNMRQGPDTVYEEVGEIGAGRRAQLLGKHDDWLKVDVAGATGWMHSSLLDVPPAELAEVPTTDDFPPPPPIWVWPAHGVLTSGFGPRWGAFHNGIDIAAGAGAPILAARSGVVTESGWCSGYGYCVRMNHPGGIETIYGHLIRQPVVGVGQEVRAGEVIGHMGSTYDARGGGFSTGVHLHFTINVNGRAVNPLTLLP